MAINHRDLENHDLQAARERLQRVLHDLHHYGIREGETVTYLQRKLIDATRQMNNGFGYNNITKAMPMGDDIYEFRYEAHGGAYKLKCWHDGREDTLHGEVANQPEWLTGIVDVAKVAGHLKTTISPPPEAILWFHTDKNRTLIKFIELT